MTNFYDSLPDNHKRFVDAYVDCLNNTTAYLKAYPDITRSTAGQNGFQLSKRPEVRKAIVEKLQEYKPDKEETLKRIVLLIQLDISDYYFEDGSFDLQKFNADGYGWMIKGNRSTKYGNDFILMDKDKALDNLARIHNLFSDAQQITVNIENKISAKEILEKKLQALDDKLNGAK